VVTAEDWDLRAMTENTLKQAVLKVARERGWHVYHVPQSTIKSAGDHGFPDLVCARVGEVRYIELKREQGALTPEQMEWMHHLPGVIVIRPSDLDSGRVLQVLA
jgi:hypothetical protein